MWDAELKCDTNMRLECVFVFCCSFPRSQSERGERRGQGTHSSSWGCVRVCWLVLLFAQCLLWPKYHFGHFCLRVMYGKHTKSHSASRVCLPFPLPHFHLPSFPVGEIWPCGQGLLICRLDLPTLREEDKIHEYSHYYWKKYSLKLETVNLMRGTSTADIFGILMYLYKTYPNDCYCID